MRLHREIILYKKYDGVRLNTEPLIFYEIILSFNDFKIILNFKIKIAYFNFLTLKLYIIL